MKRGLRMEFTFEILSCLYIIAVVVLCWSKPMWSSVLLAGGLFALLWFWGDKADGVTMVAAATLGTPAEIICVQNGVWTYDAPGLVFGIPVWLPLVWAYLLCIFRRIATSAHSLMVRVWPSANAPWRRRLFNGAGGIILVYYLVSALVIDTIIAVIFTVFMVPVVIFCRREIYVLIFLVGAVLGTLGEYMCMKLGFWQYSYPVFKSAGLPLSLPLAWGLSSAIVGRIAALFGVQGGSPVETRQDIT